MQTGQCSAGEHVTSSIPDYHVQKLALFVDPEAFQEIVVRHMIHIVPYSYDYYRLTEFDVLSWELRSYLSFLLFPSLQDIVFGG